MHASTDSAPTEATSTLAALRDWRLLAMLALGFSAGIPLLLIFSSLSLWLREAGIERAAVTFFSWAALGYSFKFVWAPLVDRLPLPLLSRALGRRRAWLFAAQLAVAGAIGLMALIDPATGGDSLVRMAMAATLLGLAAATQDIVIDAYRIEAAPARLQALMSATYIAGYRIGMVVSGAGALYLAALLGSSAEHYDAGAWQLTYALMASTLLVGLVTTLLIAEPERPQGAASGDFDSGAHLRLLAVFVAVAASFVLSFFLAAAPAAMLKAAAGHDALLGFLIETLRLGLALGVAVLSGWGLVLLGALDRAVARATWIDPARDFFIRYGLQTALLLLALIGLYRISDIVLGVISNVFYQDIGFTKPQIATAVKTFGVIVSILGGMLGGLLASRFGVMRILMLGAVLAALTNLVFVLLAAAGPSTALLYLAVSADNLAAGLASAAFVAFLSSLTSVSFTAVQYAIFSSLMTLLPKVLGGYSGGLVEGLGYPGFFVFTTLIGVPVVWLVWLAARRLEIAPR